MNSLLKLLTLLVAFFQPAISDVRFSVESSFKHDSSSFTQGLEFFNGYLYETSGMYGDSKLQIVHPDTGHVIKYVELGKQYFGEGLSIVQGIAYVLTWREKTMLIYDAFTLELLGERTFSTYGKEGWGLTHMTVGVDEATSKDVVHLVASDSTNHITFFEIPDLSASGTVLKKVREIEVKTKGGTDVRRVNELEYVDGFIFANIWYKDVIIKIDPSNGLIVDTYHMHSLFPMSTRPKHADCLNGIAYNKTTGSFILTGKYWPKFYNVMLHRQEDKVLLYL